jgi:hypothetical protein
MCCFSGKVDSVSNTNIFARASKSGGQFLVYSMQFKAGNDLAMILPIPTPKDSKDDAVKFINLENYEKFFADLHSAYPVPPSKSLARKGDDDKPAQKPIAVVEVGKFVASFVPSLKDFSRLDKQFRLADGVWEKLPQYKEFGFAVFKLKKPEKGEQKVHPMAFEFPRFDKDVLFFPTVHIHDGSVPAKAGFDHTLYCQVATDPPLSWEESPGLADTSVKLKETQGIVEANAHLYRKVMKGEFDNKDVGVKA